MKNRKKKKLWSFLFLKWRKMERKGGIKKKWNKVCKEKLIAYNNKNN